jgi:hypothetical protein
MPQATSGKEVIPVTTWKHQRVTSVTRAAGLRADFVESLSVRKCEVDNEPTYSSVEDNFGQA